MMILKTREGSILNITAVDTFKVVRVYNEGKTNILILKAHDVEEANAVWLKSGLDAGYFIGNIDSCLVKAILNDMIRDFRVDMCNYHEIRYVNSILDVVSDEEFITPKGAFELFTNNTIALENKDEYFIPADENAELNMMTPFGVPSSSVLLSGKDSWDDNEDYEENDSEWEEEIEEDEEYYEDDDLEWEEEIEDDEEYYEDDDPEWEEEIEDDEED